LENWTRKAQSQSIVSTRNQSVHGPWVEKHRARWYVIRIPERFGKLRTGRTSRCNEWLLEAAWGLAVSLWPTDTRIMVKETVHKRRSLKRKFDDQEEAVEEEGDDAKRQKGSEQGRGDEGRKDNQHTGKISGLATPLVIDYQDVAMTEEASGDGLCDELIRKAWFDFDRPCSDTVTSRMGEILQLEHGLQSKPSKDLLDSMRAHGKVMAFVEGQELFNQEDWKSWVHDNRATSESPRERRGLGNLVEVLQKASLFYKESIAVYTRVHNNLEKMEEEKAKEGVGEKDGQF
jgi:hypothetical protein